MLNQSYFPTGKASSWFSWRNKRIWCHFFVYADFISRYPRVPCVWAYQRHFQSPQNSTTNFFELLACFYLNISNAKKFLLSCSLFSADEILVLLNILLEVPLYPVHWYHYSVRRRRRRRKMCLKNRYRIVWSLHQFKFFFIDLFYFLSLSPFVSIPSLSSPFVSISSLPSPSFFSFSPHLFPPPSFISITLSYSPILSFYRFIFARLTRPNCYYKNHLMLFFSSFLWLSEDSWFFCFHQNAPPTAKSPSNNNLIFSSCWETRMAVKNQLNRMYLLLFMAIFWWSTFFFFWPECWCNCPETETK